MEYWRDVVDYEGYYQVSNLGRAKRLKGFRCLSERILKIRVGQHNQYPRINLCKIGIAPKIRYVHQLVLEAFVGPRLPEYETRHLDGSKDNNSLSNLEYGTHWQNIKDSVVHQTHFIPNCHGSNHANSKLIDSDINLILQLLISGRNNNPGRKYTQKEIGKMFNVSDKIISQIKLGKAWKHIDRSGVHD